ncbi:replicative DNA helicase [Paenibacillus chitinolyticus]|uniref:replicative DNA helicase n=1 Tax=Paenibacillus chitinolyticus TaxID=79263 RepID=UPI003660C51A
MVNNEAEQAVLGAILLEEEAFGTAVRHLKASSFARQEHQWIFEAMAELEENYKPIDFVTLTEVLQRKGQLEKIGGVSYLADLKNAVPTAANIEHYVWIVREKYLHRKTFDGIKGQLLEGAEDAAGLLASVQATVSELQDEMQDGSEFKRLGDVLQDHEELIEKRQHQAGITGVATASRDLNKLTGGRQNQDLIILAARPSIGKTAYMLNEANAAASSKTVDAVGIISLEMKDLSLGERMICLVSGLDSAKLKTGFMDSSDWAKYTYARELLRKRSIYIDDSPGITIQQIDAKVKAFKDKHGRVIIYIDYLQLISGGKKFSSREAELSFISRSLKRIARKNDCPVVAISSVGRGCEQRADKRPMLSDLRESGQIEFDADEVDFLYRDDYYNAESDKKGIIEIIVAKGRNTGTGLIEMVYIRETSKFYDINLDRGAKGHEQVECL